MQGQMTLVAVVVVVFAIPAIIMSAPVTLIVAVIAIASIISIIAVPAVRFCPAEPSLQPIDPRANVASFIGVKAVSSGNSKPTLEIVGFGIEAVGLIWPYAAKRTLNIVDSPLEIADLAPVIIAVAIAIAVGRLWVILRRGRRCDRGSRSNRGKCKNRFEHPGSPWSKLMALLMRSSV